MAQTAEITARSPLSVIAHPYFMDITGLMSGGQVLNDDNFATGMEGWVQLATPNGASNVDGSGAVFLSHRGAFSGRSVVARTIDVSTAGAFSSAMAIKRMGQFWGDGAYLAEFWTSINNATADIERPRFFSWGLDTCQADGTRVFFETRWLNYDEATTTRVKKFQIKTSAGWEDVVGGTFEWPVNENKDLPIYIALHVDTGTKKYLGMRVNNLLKVGSLAAVPDTSLSAGNPAAPDSLVPFATGLNPLMYVQNRSNAGTTRAACKLHRQRTTFLGAA